MGIEFVRKTKKSFHKGLDRGRVQLGTPHLFTRQPDVAPRAYAATLEDGQTVTAGEKLGVRLDGEDVLIMRGLRSVAKLNSPPNELISALLKSHGEAGSEVLQVHVMAGVVEVIIW